MPRYKEISTQKDKKRIKKRLHKKMVSLRSEISVLEKFCDIYFYSASVFGFDFTQKKGEKNV